MGWEVQPWQPQHPRTERAAALVSGSTGTDAKFVFVPATPPVNWGWEVHPFQPRAWTPNPPAAATLKGDEGIQAPFDLFQPDGWEIQPYQPSHLRTEKAASFLKGHEGIDGIYVFVSSTQVSWGYEIQPAVMTVPRRGAALWQGDDGTKGAFTRWVNDGWDIQSAQPSHPRVERAAAIMAGESGIEFPFDLFQPYGWDVPSPQPPHPFAEKRGAFLKGNEGTDGKFVFVPASQAVWGWDVSNIPLSTTVGRKFYALKGRVDFAFFPPWVNGGWEVQPWQPPHPRAERAGALMLGDGGIEAPYVFVPSTAVQWAWDVQPFQPPHPRTERAAAVMRGDEGNQGRFINFRPDGWDVAPFQPPHLRTERAGGIMAGEPGTEGKFVFVPPTAVAWGYDHPIQIPHPRFERAGAIMTGEPGIEGKFVFVAPAAAVWGYDTYQAQIIRPMLSRAALFPMLNIDQVLPAYGASLVRSTNNHTTGKYYFEVTVTAAAIAAQVGVGVDDGTENLNLPGGQAGGICWCGNGSVNYNGALAIYHAATFTVGDILSVAIDLTGSLIWFRDNAGNWNNNPAANPATGVGGFSIAAISGTVFALAQLSQVGDEIDANFAGGPTVYQESVPAGFVPWGPFTIMGWDSEQWLPHLTAHWNRGAAMLRDIETFNKFVFVPPAFITIGWNVEHFQPPHPRFERAGAVMTGAPGIDGKFIFVPPPFSTESWSVQPFQPPFRINRGVATLKGDEGIQYPFVNWRNDGWDVHPFQPPHRSPEQKFAAIARGDEGTEAKYVRWLNAGWEILPYQPQHPSPERLAAAILKGDDGIEQRLLRWFNMGWEVAPHQPSHPRTERAGAVMLGDQQPWDKFVFVPPPILARFDPNYLTWPPPRVQVTSPARRDFETWPPPRKTVTKPTD